VYILYLEFNAWTIWGFGKPHEKIDMLVAVEKQIVIATALKADIVYDFASIFAFKFRLNFCVWD
jgi:hypothetical protein